jgi:hypothetical protein
MRHTGLLILLAPCLLAANLLRNPSFEEAKDGRPVGWSTGNAWFEKPKGSGLAKVELDTTHCQGPGQNSLRITGSKNRGLAQQVLTVKPEWGRRLRLAGWLRLKDTDHACARVDVECRDQAGKYLGGIASLGTDWRQSTADWQRFEKVFDLPEAAHTLRVHCCSDRANSGVMWFDNLVLEPAQPDPPPAPEPVPNATRAVEPLIPLDDFEGTDIAWTGNAWGNAIRPTFSLETGDAPSGKQFLRIDCPSAKGNMVDRVWTHQGDWDGISLWVRRVAGKGSVTLYAMCGRVTFHGKRIRPTKEWTRVTLRVSDLRYAWGAKDDREKAFDHRKVTKLSFGHEDVITFDIDQVALDLDDGVVLTRAFGKSQPGNILPLREIPDLDATLRPHPEISAEAANAGNAPATVEFQFDCMEPDGSRKHRVSQTREIPSRQRVVVSTPLPAIDPGYSSVRVRLLHGGLPVGEHAVGFVAPPIPDSTGRPFMGASGFGMGAGNVIIGKRIGVRAAEIMFSWAQGEPERGRLELAGAWQTLTAFQQGDMDVTGMILLSTDRIPKWARPAEKDPRGDVLVRSPEEFAEFVEALGKRFGPHIRRWAFTCEIDLLAHRLAGGTDQYVELVQAGTKALRRVAPDAIIGGVGVSGGDGRKSPRFPVARKLWAQLGDDLDGMFFDAYASPRYYGPGLRVVEPEENDLVGILQDALALVRSKGPDKRISIEEKGWAIDQRLPVDAPEAMDMAACLARSYLLARSVDEVEHYMWFQMDTGWREGDYSYTLFKREFDHMNPRPGVAAYATVAHFLAGAEAPRRIALHRDLYALVFQVGKGSRAALWTPLDSPVRFRMELPRNVAATTFLGAPYALPSEAEGIPLSRQPIYLDAPETDAATFARRLESGRFALPCARLTGALVATNKLEVRVRNLLSAPLKGNLQVEAPAGWQLATSRFPVEIPANDTKSVLAELKAAPSVPPLRPGVFSFTLDAGTNGRIQQTIEPTIHAIPRLAQAPTVDGDLAEFSNVPAIRLADHTYLDPPDAPSAKLWTGIDDLSADVRLAWSTKGLHFAAVVRDDVFVQERTGSSIWANDSIQIGFDPNNDALPAEFAGKSGYDPDDSEFGIALTPKGPQTFQWSGSPDGAGRFPPGAQLAVKRVDDTTVYEWTVPWELLKLAPQPGRVFGFNAVFLDVDQKGKTARYWMGLTPGICGGKDPAAFHDFVLLP